MLILGSSRPLMHWTSLGRGFAVYMVSPPENQDLSKTPEQPLTASSGLNFSLTQRALPQQTSSSAYKNQKRKCGKFKFISMILDYLYYQKFNNAVRVAEINCSSSPKKPHKPHLEGLKAE